MSCHSWLLICGDDALSIVIVVVMKVVGVALIDALLIAPAAAARPRR
ncbi:metal ABC transporter permease [Loktanella sp. DJP18]